VVEGVQFLRMGPQIGGIRLERVKLEQHHAPQDAAADGARLVMSELDSGRPPEHPKDRAHVLRRGEWEQGLGACPAGAVR
jgi:hypothetical protein